MENIIKYRHIMLWHLRGGRTFNDALPGTCVLNGKCIAARRQQQNVMSAANTISHTDSQPASQRSGRQHACIGSEAGEQVSSQLRQSGKADRFRRRGASPTLSVIAEQRECRRVLCFCSADSDAIRVCVPFFMLCTLRSWSACAYE